MKRILSVLLVGLLVVLPLSGFCLTGPLSEQIWSITEGEVDIEVASTDTVYSQSFDFNYGTDFALWTQATSDGDVDIDVELEQSYIRPTTEGTTDTVYWAIPETAPVTLNLTDENVHIIALSPVAMKYGRLKFTGSGANGTVTVDSRLSIVEGN